MRANACKAALRCFIWHRNETTEARRKPVLIDRFNLTHPILLSHTHFSHDRASVRGRVVPTRVYPKWGVSPRKRAVRAAYERV